MSCHRIALLALFLSMAGSGIAQNIDLNGNGVSDIWELMYAAEGFNPDPDADSDEDGLINRMEALAGTNPLDPRSNPRISSFIVATNTACVSMMGSLGKHYQLQASETLCGSSATNWFNEVGIVARTNNVVTLSAPADRASKFFRMIVSDVDTDGDGLNDWEEYQLGLDPLSPNSNSELDAEGKPLGDYEYAVNWLGAASHSLQPQSSSAMSVGVPTLSLAIYLSSTAGGTGLTGEYYTNSSATYASPLNFNPTNLFLTTNDSVIDFRWGSTASPDLSNGFYSVRWTGQLEPQYSELYTFETRTDDGVKLWVNDQLLIDRWQIQGVTTWSSTIQLTAGVRYNIRMEYFNLGKTARAQLYWYSASQPRQIIPANRLYPASGGLAPSTVTSTLKAIAFVGQPFSYTITAANSPLGYVVTNVPPGLSYNPSNNVISGIPMLAGNYDVSISVSNVVGVNESLLNLDVIDTGSSVSREVWLNATGTGVTNIPLALAASLTNTLGTLEGITNFGDNYGERIRGYLTAPVTGNYYFWIAANSSAELWISNDAEPANKVRRAYVINPKVTTPRQWTLQPNQKSSWLALEAGRRYYIEILHKAGKGVNDHWSVAWLQDPTGTNTVPGGIVPGYLLSQYSNTPPALIPGTLYSANMVSQSGALSSGVGSATLRLSADETQAVLRFGYGGLSSPESAKHIHADTYLGKNSQGQIVFDIDTATQEPDGSYIWNLAPSGPLSTADLVEIIKEGKSYINIHSVNYPGGEINGHFSAAEGSPTFSPPPTPPVWVDDHSNSNAATRFLLQATFGASPADIKSVKSLGYSRWIDGQFKLPVSSHLATALTTAGVDGNSYYPGTLAFNTWWQQSVTAPDQLRQRVAFALSEILVASESGPLSDNGRALSSYYDTLLKNAFGNFRDLLENVTLSPAMGIYLDMRRNDKGNPLLGTHPNENYAREILQLFSVGLNRMWPDGTLVLNSEGGLVPTYNQDVIIGFSKVFTGWNYYQTNQANKRLPINWNPSQNYTNPMVLVPTHHELGTKLLLDNIVLPAAQGAQANSASNSFDLYCSQELDLALDSIFKNENVGPFICRQLIQRLVTSHPSRDYLYRVVQKFNNNGVGVRGDMKAVIKAILLDYEARSSAMLGSPTFGKLREPVLRATAIARALPGPAPVSASYKQSGNQTITVTTSKPHRLSSNDDVFLKFTGNPSPNSQIYNNVTVTGEKSFTVNAQGISVGTYSQTGNIITVTNSGHGLNTGYQIYLNFTSGGAAKGIYTVATILSGSAFTVTNSSSITRTGACVFPKWTNGEFDQSGTNITFNTAAPHGLKAGNTVFLVFPGGSPSTNGVYKITKVLTPTRFTVVSGISGNSDNTYPLLLPLVVAPSTRSGSVSIRYSTWNMNYTDSGNSSTLSQTPLNSPTVFNYFFPDYKFQGILASAGLTTPEFQLTSDTSIVLQMNFVSSSIFNNGSNTNGLSSFAGGSGAIALDLGPWMTPAFTSDAGIPGLVDALNTQLCAGQLSPAAKAIIVGYVANPRFGYTLPKPTFTQMRDRVRAVVHLIVASPDFAIQR
ncbi:MAG: DUF1800 family protein [Verrucomicrobia bacterium]|nr:DUF1800 family protein [Verrucomicrobiota bacterium]